ncbi:hypothetical protein FKW77_000808 [Venturia effusa]|uniref:Uncharacterized protein n=1 Tax=Venturia effusa TaxID=50376 RepID=A0A517L2P6_9PEZI|nr:hypothetical protein FKW77_000808 [Venturia effusa]
MSDQYYTRLQGAPFECQSCYAYATADHDDGYIGVKEWEHYCGRHGYRGACWTPAGPWNPDPNSSGPGQFKDLGERSRSKV